MPPFEATRSFCYQFARYTVLAEIEAVPEVKAGGEFRMVDLTQRILDAYLTPGQQQLRIKKANSDDIGRGVLQEFGGRSSTPTRACAGIEP